MGLFWMRILVVGIFYPYIVSLNSIDSLYLDLIHRNISDFTSFDNFYRGILKDVNHHRSINIVSSPINVEKIRLNNYNEDYLKNSCYETATDLLNAHGYDEKDLKLSVSDIKSLLPAVLYTIENPGCTRAVPPIKQSSFINIWIFGLILIVIMKFVHLIIFFGFGNHLSALTSHGMSTTIPNHNENTIEVHFSPTKYHVWLGLGFNAFTCGIILGTVIYHLIPQIYEVPNEDFDYMYLLRGTIILFGVFLFFIVEKILRFRFRVDETPVDEPVNETGESVDTPMIQMTDMHVPIHIENHNHTNSSEQVSPNIDNANEDIALQNHLEHVQDSHDDHHHEHNTRNLIIYHIIYDLSNDIIYGCGLSTALAYDRLVGCVLGILIFSEGFRRHSQIFSSLGRKSGFIFIILSIVFLSFGYIIGASLIQFQVYVHVLKGYIYSIVYGALFYTALVLLIPELNDFSQHLQVVLKTVNQTSQQRHAVQTFIFLCQNLFLIIGVLIALIFACIWRYYHLKHIFEYVCERDPLRIFCPKL